MGTLHLLRMPKKPRAIDIKDDVSRRLKCARSIVFDSAAACARKLEVPKNTWQHYEDATRYPDPYHLVRFLDMTGFTADFIYRGRIKGIEEDVQIRLAAEYPDLIDEAPDVGRSSMAKASA